MRCIQCILPAFPCVEKKQEGGSCLREMECAEYYLT